MDSNMTRKNQHRSNARKLPPKRHGSAIRRAKNCGASFGRRMTLCRLIRILDRLLRHMERGNRHIDALLAESKRKGSDREERLSRLKMLLEAPEIRDRPN